MVDDDKFLIIPMGKESKAITQVISNDTAMQVMDMLADGPMSTSAVAEKLAIPLTTAQYNIEKLMESGLVKIEKTRYSEKGREVKLYRASRRFIMIVPEKTGGQAIIDALKKYILLIPVAAVLAIAVEYLDPISSYINQQSGGATSSPVAQPLTYAGYSNMSLASNGALPSTIQPASPASGEYSSAAQSSVVDQLSQNISDFFHHSGVLFFAGCLLVLFLLVVLEYAQYKRRAKKQ
jgi:DNA-binding transcriptional ArsR family regulator